VEESYTSFWTTGAFLLGALTSIVSGYIGMMIAVKSNFRTTYACLESLGKGFVVAFRGGAVLGFMLVGLGLLNLILMLVLYWWLYLPANPIAPDYLRMLEAIAGYGLGGSTVALFGRVGGGIYTKAADVGSDLAGKVEAALDEDDPSNPGTIADNVGDNVGDIAGMGADLFGSFAESTCAALVVSATSVELATTSALFFPLLISANGIIVSLCTTFFATNIMAIVVESDVQKVIKYQLMISTLLMTPVLFFLSVIGLPYEFTIGNETDVKVVKYYYCFICAACGLWSGLAIGYATEYYTSYEYGPVQALAKQCESGPSMNLISGLALGFVSTILPALCIAATIFVSYYLAGMYGIALGALGMLSTMCVCLTIDGYGPISDNAGGLATLSGFEEEEARERTDMLDAAGNTTAAIGKGFAVGSAALVSLALFGAFVTRSKVTQPPTLLAADGQFVLPTRTVRSLRRRHASLRLLRPHHEICRCRRQQNGPRNPQAVSGAEAPR
jgi:H(+)-translocating pyrophosphatase